MTRELPQITQRQIPDAQVLAAPQVVSVDNNQVASAVNNLGKTLEGGADLAYKTGLQRDKFNYSIARSKFLQQSVDLQNQLENDPDYANLSQKYEEGMAKIKTDTLQELGSNSQAQLLDQEINLYKAKQFGAINKIAQDKQEAFAIVEADKTMEINLNLAAKRSTNDLTRESLLFTSKELYANAIPENTPNKAILVRENDKRVDRRFAETYLEGHTPAEQINLLDQENKKSGSNFTKHLPADIRQDFLIKAKNQVLAETRVKINSDLDDVKQAAKLGLKVPKETLMEIANKAEGAGMSAEAQSVRKYSDIQEDANIFAIKSLAQQKEELKSIGANIETGNIKEVDKYATFNMIFENKIKVLKDDPYSYYVAQDIIKEPTPLDFSSPQAVAQNLESRRIDVQKVKDIEGQSFNLPVLTKAEIDHIKSITQNQSADQAALVLNNIGQNLKTEERATLAKQFSKEDAPTLAVAMSMNNSKDATNIIAGSKLKGEVSPSKLRTEVSSKLSGLIFDPEKNEMLHSAVYDYYKKLAFDTGNIEKDVDLNLLDNAIEKTIGKPVEISPAGKRSKIFTYKDDSGNLVSEDDLEDTFNSIDDDVLKKTNDSLPMLPSGDIISAQEILKDTQLRSYGDGLYIPYYEGLGFLTGQDGKPYVIDARKVKALTGNAPANDGKFSKIKIRPSQSIFGFN